MWAVIPDILYWGAAQTLLAPQLIAEDLAQHSTAPKERPTHTEDPKREVQVHFCCLKAVLRVRRAETSLMHPARPPEQAQQAAGSWACWAQVQAQGLCLTFRRIYSPPQLLHGPPGVAASAACGAIRRRKENKALGQAARGHPPSPPQGLPAQPSWQGGRQGSEAQIRVFSPHSRRGHGAC